MLQFHTQISNSSGLILDEQPAKVGVALKLFLQGLGLVPSLSFLSVLPPPPQPSHLHNFTVHGKAAQLHPCQAY